MTTITITGIEELFRKLDTVIAIETLVPPMQRSVYRMVNAMADYPPPPAKSRYARTGTLGRRWTSKVARQSSGVTGTVGNNTSYGPFVQSKAFQARVHRGRWQTDEQVLTDNLQTIQTDFERAIEAALR